MVSIGAHWDVMQIAAWVKMVKDYSEEKGLVEGLKETFDGEHPCAMCKKLSAERDGKQQPELPMAKDGSSALSKWVSMTPTSLLPQLSWRAGEAITQGDAFAAFYSKWDAEPPVPPPKIAA